jgi:hypothetical protein
VARTRRRAVWLLAAGFAAGTVGFGGDASPRDGIVDGSLTAEQAAQRPEADQLIVSIGDSVASGEGNPDVRGRLGRPRAGCWRAATARSFQAMPRRRR